MVQRLIGTAPEAATVAVFAGELHAGYIGHYVRFWTYDEQHAIVTMITAELRQIYHNSAETTLHYGLNAENEVTLLADDRVIVNPVRDYSDVPHLLGNDSLHDVEQVAPWVVVAADDPSDATPAARVVRAYANVPAPRHRQERNRQVTLPDTWTWTSTDVTATGRTTQNSAEVSVTVTAMFDVLHANLTPIFAHATAERPFQPTSLKAQWLNGQLMTIELDGPQLDVRGNARRGRYNAYRAFRNEIALARADAPAGKSAAFSADVIRTLDDWANNGGIPTINISHEVKA